MMTIKICPEVSLLLAGRKGIKTYKFEPPRLHGVGVPARAGRRSVIH